MYDDPPRLQPTSRFATTHWSVVLRAAGSQSEASQQALGELIQTYWYPLYAFARRRGNHHHDAMDLTQGFFTHVLGGKALGSVSPTYGHFRSFLLASFKNFMANEHRARETVRRGGAVNFVPLRTSEFETRYDREPVDDATPETLFERQWAESLLDCVHRRLAQDYERADKAELYRLLQPHLTGSDEALPRAEIGVRLHLSLAAVAMSIHRMRRRYGELLREEVAATIDPDANIDDEVRALMAIVSVSSKGG